MTNKDMEIAIAYIRGLYKDKTIEQKSIHETMTFGGYTDTEIRYCYVLATGKNMTI